ncbi:unnamed protein product, partial [Sphagnum jensenii]
LKNKQSVRSELSQFVDDMIVAEAVISHIVDTPASEKEFLEQLYILDHKISFVKEQSFREAKSCSDVMEILNNLKIKAITKIREYILKKIHSCRKAMTNYQIPQNALLKNKFFYQFLMSHDREVAREIQTEYLDTMSKVYFSYFKEYLHRLSKLQYEEVPDKDDLMGIEDTGKNIKQQLNKRIQDFVEELLYPHFGGMMAFVKDCEAYIEKSDSEALKREENKVTNLIKSFNIGWRKALEEISREVMNCFTNFKNGNNIQQSALTQIIQYYHRFQKIVSQNPFKNNPVR